MNARRCRLPPGLDRAESSGPLDAEIPPLWPSMVTASMARPRRARRAAVPDQPAGTGGDSRKWSLGRRRLFSAEETGVEFDVVHELAWSRPLDSVMVLHQSPPRATLTTCSRTADRKLVGCVAQRPSASARSKPRHALVDVIRVCARCRTSAPTCRRRRASRIAAAIQSRFRQGVDHGIVEDAQGVSGAPSWGSPPPPIAGDESAPTPQPESARRVWRGPRSDRRDDAKGVGDPLGRRSRIGCWQGGQWVLDRSGLRMPRNSQSAALGGGAAFLDLVGCEPTSERMGRTLDDVIAQQPRLSTSTSTHIAG